MTELKEFGEPDRLAIIIGIITVITAGIRYFSKQIKEVVFEFFKRVEELKFQVIINLIIKNKKD